MNFLRKMLSSNSKEELAVIPSGQLFLKRSPNSPRGVIECLFKDSVASIRRTSLEYNYQLVVQRVFEEGEEALEGSEDNSDLDDDNKEEWSFLLDEALEISYLERDGNIVVTWLDTSGDTGDVFEFICEKDISPKVFDHFDNVCKICQYERKYGKTFNGDPALDLTEFDFEPPVPSTTSPIASPTSTPTASRNPSRRISSSVAVESDITTGSPSIRATDYNADDNNKEQQDAAILTPHSPPASNSNASQFQTPVKQTARELVPPPVSIPSVEPTMISKHSASLHLYDSQTGSFVEQASRVQVSVTELEKFEFWLEVSNESSPLIGLDINSDMNPCFNYDHLSFIFNYICPQGGFSWLLKFDSFDDLDKFQFEFMKAIWEKTNQKRWTAGGEKDQEYLNEAFADMSIDEESEGQFEDEEELEDAEESTPDRLSRPADDENYDEDEDYDRSEKFAGQGKNSQLAVGMSKDRSYVVRGDKLGVFKQTADNDLEFYSAIDNISTPSGRSFSPKKVMLHCQDSSLLMQDSQDLNKLFRMDLEYGKVIDEYQVDEFTKVNAFGPSEKFSQTTNEQTLVGISNNGLFRIDPRLSGYKIVDDEKKVSLSKLQFAALTTTNQGNIAVASATGDIRLYDRIGVNAKTLIPSLGDPIIGIEASADGKWVLATCKNYLLLIDTTIKQGKNEGHSGFLKSFSRDSKPRPKRLQISPEHVAFMYGETQKPLSLTKAYFNAGVDIKEQSIISSSGPYVITWNLRKVLRGDKEPYLIKRYADNVTADNFKFGTDKNVIIALEDDVGMVNRSTFRKPTRQSLATPARRVQAMSRNSIVNSPF